ncbi:MAG: 2-iminoacetate synthase ThiH [Candidatus Omnitrophica bacterium]|nr:2-iminoacetate synthase ThiH [Candidatus Omnitrophota bacterium]
MNSHAIAAILNDPSREQLEALAQHAKDLTRQYFGRAIGLYTPLYISNYCSSHCTYCGFHSHHKIKRVKLTLEEIDTELAAIAATGIQNVLLLTGESPQATPVRYIQDAVVIAKKYFQGIALEVFPMSVDDYRALYAAGADGVTIYQETYDRARYKDVHLGGQKQDYDFRYDAPRRIAAAGMRHISIGILLGLGPLAEDLASLYAHLRDMEQAFPGVEYSLSFPRLRAIKGAPFTPNLIDDITLVKIMALTRTLFPRVGINLSTRESAALRNRMLEICVTRVSAGSKTTVGGYAGTATEGAPQFDINDARSTPEMIEYLKTHGFDPVFTDWRRIDNTQSTSS